MTKERMAAVLGSILIALGAWNLTATRSAGEAIARMEERQIAANRTTEMHAKDITDLRLRITAVEIQFAQFKSGGRAQ